jgi:hypothetical protein
MHIIYRVIFISKVESAILVSGYLFFGVPNYFLKYFSPIVLSQKILSDFQIFQISMKHFLCRINLQMKQIGCK